MAQFTSPLDRVRVAAPCPADWNRMAGGERVRFCAQCNLNVYNLSGMTRREAEALLTRTEGRLCVRFYRRGDGTILTKQCPVGLGALKARVSRTAAALFSAVVGFLGGLGLHGLTGAAVRAASPWNDSYTVMGSPTMRDTGSYVRPAPPPVVDEVERMGQLVVTPGEVKGEAMFPREVGRVEFIPPPAKKRVSSRR